MKNVSMKSSVSDIKRLNRIAKRAATKDGFKGRAVSNDTQKKRINRDY